MTTLTAFTLNLPRWNKDVVFNIFYWTVHAFCVVLAALCACVPELVPYPLLWLTAALVCMGCLLPFLDILHIRCLPKKWMHNTLTAARVAVCVVLLHSFQLVSVLAVLTFFSALVLGAILVRNSNKHGLIAWFAGLVLLLNAMLSDKELVLQVLFIGTVLWARRETWVCPTKMLTKAQHQDIWWKLANNPTLLWARLSANVQLHIGQQDAFDTLDVKTLLGFFESDLYHHRHTKHVQLVRQMEQYVRAAINAKEPRAIPIWELYPAEEAAKHIASIDTRSRVTHESFELPAL